jgi:hypothetical protein
MIKKDLIIAVLSTFCLTSTLFLVIPTRSSSNSFPYDPWVDLNGDGKIDIYDITWAAELYDTSGDPTRNVNVTNWPSWWPSGIPQKGNHTERITVFSINTDWSMASDRYFGGVILSLNSFFVFEFNPIGARFNVSKAHITMPLYALSGGGTNTRFTIELNQQSMYKETSISLGYNALYVVSLELESSLVASIRQGINTLQISAEAFNSPQWWAVETYQITIFITYEYSS